MPRIEIIKEKDAVLVPIKQWEKVQNELTLLRKKVNKANVLQEIERGIVAIEEDLKRPRHRRKITKTADEFLAELENEA